MLSGGRPISTSQPWTWTSMGLVGFLGEPWENIRLTYWEILLGILKQYRLKQMKGGPGTGVCNGEWGHDKWSSTDYGLPDWRSVNSWRFLIVQVKIAPESSYILEVFLFTFLARIDSYLNIIVLLVNWDCYLNNVPACVFSWPHERLLTL